MASTASRIDIYNMALGFIGTRMIASPNEKTPEAIQCDLYWDRARRSALRDYPYSFAQTRVRLAEKTLPDVYFGQWRFCYGLPDKVLSIHDVHDGTQNGVRKSAWRLENAEGHEIVILTRQELAVADCTFDVEDIAQWDELFVMAMARKLACLIAVSLLKNNPNKVQELEQLYQMAIPKAEAHDASEREVKRRPDSWLASRGQW